MARYARRPLPGRLALPGVSKITPETDPPPKRTSHHYAGTLPRTSPPIVVRAADAMDLRDQIRRAEDKLS
jgi:hypothetical protein